MRYINWHLHLHYIYRRRSAPTSTCLEVPERRSGFQKTSGAPLRRASAQFKHWTGPQLTQQLWHKTGLAEIVQISFERMMATQLTRSKPSWFSRVACNAWTLPTLHTKAEQHCRIEKLSPGDMGWPAARTDWRFNSVISQETQCMHKGRWWTFRTLVLIEHCD